MNQSFSSSQGSLWRRWDPHVHLPGTLLNDQFGGMSIGMALEQLAAAQPTIEAIGVTDYFTTASYRRAAAALNSGIAPTIKFAFPNVELRLDNATSSNRGVNIHLLCQPDEVDGLDQFLSRLEFTWAETTYGADEPSLIQLGRDFSADNSLDEKSALIAGATQFKVNFEHLRNRLRTDRWASKNILVAMAGGQRDGTSGLREPDGSFAARRQSIESLADIIFSSNLQQSLFWSGRGDTSESELERVYGGPKLCLHGSDAHSPPELGTPDLDRYCWLKGDANFDALRLACISPNTRCHIGPDSPLGLDAHGRIVRLDVPGEDWFTNEAIHINPGLVAIIGPRGSGKTALADLIAAGAGSTEPYNNDQSFVRRAGYLLQDAMAAVQWSHDESTIYPLGDPRPDDYRPRPVRYLSQQFVERLCASDGVSDQLLREIERVVFEACPVDQRQGAMSFRELLDIKLTSAKASQAAHLTAVLSCSDEITEVRARRRQLEPKRKELAEHKTQAEKLDGQVQALTNKADPISAARLGLVSGILHHRQQEVQNLDRQRTALLGLQNEVRVARDTTFPQYLRKLQSDYAAANLSTDQWAAFRVDFVGDTDNVIAAALHQLDQSIKQVQGIAIADASNINLDGQSESDLATVTVSELMADVARLQALVGLDTERGKQLATMTNAAVQLGAKIQSLDEEIKQIESESSEALVERRLEHYKAYFSALLEEETQLRYLYEPLKQILQQIGSSVSKLQFDVRRVVDTEAWSTEGESYLDLRKDGRFRGEGALRRIAESELVRAWEIGDADSAAHAIGDFVTNYSDDLRRQQLPRGTGADAYREWERDVARWLYRTDHIRLQYSLEYDGLNIERLSPGMRGIVLLLLYLAVDQQESDPLIIDQPEENLDPESVYTELVNLFRMASERRQIIMVTHNANLVVNTDVDQVVVASCGPLEEGRLPEFSYQSGGLEDPNIRLLVCEILEGGAEAFRQRARRLGLDMSAAIPESMA